MALYKILGIIALGLSLMGQGYSASAATPSSVSSATADWAPCEDALKTGQGLWFNMMWINRAAMPEAPYIHGPSKDEAGLREAFKNVVAWAKILPPQSVFNIWYDGALVGKDAAANTQKVIKAMCEDAKVASSIQLILRDVQDVEFDSSYFAFEDFKPNASLPRKVRLRDLVQYTVDVERLDRYGSWKQKDVPLSWFFSCQMMVYFRVDLLREMVAHWALTTNNQVHCFVYSDIDLSPKEGYTWQAADQKAIFSDNVQTILSQAGVVLLGHNEGWGYYENGFFTMTRHRPLTLAAKKMWIIQSAMQWIGVEYNGIKNLKGLEKELLYQDPVRDNLSRYAEAVFNQYPNFMRHCSPDGGLFSLGESSWGKNYDSPPIVPEGIHVPPRNKSYA